jgi:anthranilate synthase/aminodeoxychorismate synthase-like glutamine amidotransferase
VKLLYVDHYDSFAYNVVHLLASQGAVPVIVKTDDPKLQPDLLDGYDALVVGPGPGHPRELPAVLQLIRVAIDRGMPTLGVCLGLQAIGEALGGSVVHAPQLMHGKTSRVEHQGTGLFNGIPSPITVTRYHSLCLDSQELPSEITVVAKSEDGVIQAIAHKTRPTYAVQFHPESVLSEYGAQIVRNFLEVV